MHRKLWLAAAVTAIVMCFSVFAFAEDGGEGVQVSVGGHVKMTIFDRVTGISNIGPSQQEAAKSFGINFRELDLYVSARINDFLGLEVDPKFSASTGATPKLGQSVTYTANSDYAFGGFGHGKAVLTAKLPYDVEMEIGQIHPIFTMDYGKEMFWDEMLNGTKFGCNDNLGAYHDQGIQLYRSFDLGDVSLPVYLYYLNGNNVPSLVGGKDGNNSPGAMVHIEPVWGPLTLTGSIVSSRYDPAELKAWTKWSGGVLVNWEGLGFRAEYVSGKQEKMSGGRDGLSEGYYALLSYKVLPWLKLFARHDSALDNYYKVGNSTVWSSTRYITNIAGLDIEVADGTALQFQLDIADWRTGDGVQKLVYTRPYLGVRCTF